jgi:hypothetical protein
MFPTILSRRFAPAASVQSSYLTLSGCQLLSQGGPRVRQARHRRRQQTLLRQPPCAHHVLHYTVQALRARGKRAVVLPHAFGLPAIVAGWTSSATSTASAAAANTATTVVLCASCSPLYCPGASRPRQACSRLTSRFRVTSYCRRVDLECDKHGIGGGSKHCDDNDAKPDA